MKKIIIILFVMMPFAKVNAQNLHTYADTANYLIHEIKYKKNLYIGQPLSVLLDSLQIRPVHTFTGWGGNKENFGKRIMIDFNWERSFNKVHFISVEFDSVPPYNALFPVFYPAVGQGGSLESILSVYRSLIIKDVGVKDYTDDEPLNPDVHY